jgi:hypothetical protein
MLWFRHLYRLCNVISFFISYLLILFIINLYSSSWIWLNIGWFHCSFKGSYYFLDSFYLLLYCIFLRLPVISSSFLFACIWCISQYKSSHNNFLTNNIEAIFNEDIIVPSWSLCRKKSLGIISELFNVTISLCA